MSYVQQVIREGCLLM